MIFASGYLGLAFRARFGGGGITVDIGTGAGACALGVIAGLLGTPTSATASATDPVSGGATLAAGSFGPCLFQRDAFASLGGGPEVAAEAAEPPLPSRPFPFPIGGRIDEDGTGGVFGRSRSG